MGFYQEEWGSHLQQLGRMIWKIAIFAGNVWDKTNNRLEIVGHITGCATKDGDMIWAMEWAMAAHPIPKGIRAHINLQ